VVLALLLLAVIAGLMYALLPSAAPTPRGGSTGSASAHTGRVTTDAGQGLGARRATPEQVNAVVQAATKLQASNEALQARTVLEGAAREFPGEPDLLIALGQLLMQQGDHAGAYAAYAGAIAAGDSSGSSPGESRAALHYAAGVAALQINENDRAEEHFVAALAADPKTAEYHSAIAQVHTRKNRLPEASAELMKAATMEPARGKYWANLAELELRQNRAPVALSYIGKAREAEPRFAGWRLVEARALNRVGRAADALNTLSGLEPGERFQMPVLQLMAESHGLLGRPDRAAEMFREASDATPADASLAYEAALASERAGMSSESRRLARRAADQGHADAQELVKRLVREEK